MLRTLTRPRRVVITGMGCVTPLGVGREAFWTSLLEGKSGTRKITAFDPSTFSVQVAAEVPDFDWEAQLNPKDRKHVARTVPLALGAAREALEDAGLFPNDLSLSERRVFGVELGTGGGGLAFTEQQYEYWYVGPTTKASVYTIPSSTHGGLSSELSMAFGLRGLSHIVSTGCTSSTDALAYASQHIALGRQDMMLSGGVDAPIAPGILAAFNLMTVLTNEWNDEPHRASRPFSRNRSGMVLGEGAWIYVLEELSHAKARGAKIYAEITGYGSTCDAYHRVRLAEDGDEPARAMRLALEDAGRETKHVDYVNLHGTSTLLNDRIETSALKLAFDGLAKRIPMSSTKSQIGHPQGASGAAGLGAALCAINRNKIPPTINLDEPDPSCDLDYVPNVAREADVRIALCNCIGFGSKNSALVVERFV
ncbi:MAG TPA: beta-ketoacyl-[acyl-carrier-protein] synthase family protein [Pyrinomonadaceae bacterium]|nr:beta-ketoacyl-[acyl-carrier-protein] synthase family protein [Pyrinomonadaceae bacterium]